MCRRTRQDSDLSPPRDEGPEAGKRKIKNSAGRFTLEDGEWRQRRKDLQETKREGLYSYLRSGRTEQFCRNHPVSGQKEKEGLSWKGSGNRFKGGPLLPA